MDPLLESLRANGGTDFDSKPPATITGYFSRGAPPAQDFGAESEVFFARGRADRPWDRRVRSARAYPSADRPRQVAGRETARRRSLSIGARRLASHIVGNEAYRCGRFLASVRGRRALCREHFEIVLLVRGFPEAVPGQFVHIRCRELGRGASHPQECSKAAGDPAGAEHKSHAAPDEPFLRRPFSIAGLFRSGVDCEIKIIGRVIGPGTAWLNGLSSGACVDILGPLGRGFERPCERATVLLIAGGVGLPPILWLADELAGRRAETIAIYGARSRDLVPLSIITEPSITGTASPCAEEFARNGIPLIIATEDGSCGFRGRVTDVLARRLASGAASAPPEVFACGPEAMLKQVAQMCGQAGARCQAAMERVMGCGMGTCQSCVIPVHDENAPDGWRYALCCKEGPVFDARRVGW